MKISVYGVTNWDNEEEAQLLKPTLQEWKERIDAYIPYTELFLTTGSYSPPEFCPIDVPIHQIQFYKGLSYSQVNNYFHFGFKTGIWKKLLDNDFDILIHCQTTRFIGRSIKTLLEVFIKKEEAVMAPRFSSLIGTSIDVGFLCMKKPAALIYAATGYRQSFAQNSNAINCEEEAYLLFEKSWFNPWPEMLTTKQLDIAYCSSVNDKNRWHYSPFSINNKTQFNKLPIIANGKHVTEEFLQSWKKANPIIK